MKCGKYDGIPARNEEAGFEWGTLKVDSMGFIKATDDEVLIANKSLSWWESEYGFPLHIIYAPILIENIRRFKRIFETYYPHGHIRFAGKVNAHPTIFRLIVKEGVGADVASLNEMKAALQGGMNPEDLDINGNAKSDALIHTGIKLNSFFIADSYEELKNIHQIAEYLGKQARVALRIAGFSMDNVTDANIFTAGIWSKFGENLNNVPEIIDTLHTFPYLDFQGFHSHIGSQITDPEPYYMALGRLIEFGHLLNQHGGHCRVINIGGGFPAEYVNQSEWEYLVNRVKTGYIAGQNGDHTQAFVWNNEHGGLAVQSNGAINPEIWSGEKMYSKYPREKMLEKVLTGEVSVHNQKKSVQQALQELGNPKLVIEPGRSMAEDSGLTLVKVSHVRQVAGNHQLTTVEANVTNFSTAMLLPPVNHWTILNNPYHTDQQPFETFLAGNLCYSGDIISKYKVFLQRKPRRGDILACYNTGAYDPSFFAANTNSFPRPARILTDEYGVIDIIKKRDRYEDIFSLEERLPLEYNQLKNSSIQRVEYHE